MNVDSICSLVHAAIPKAVKDGRFVLKEDQQGEGDEERGVFVAPPRGFLPKLGRNFRVSLFKY